MTNAEARFNKSHIRKVYACLAVTCHLHFWQNDRDFLRATVVTRGWNGYRNKSQHRKSTLEKKILPPFQQGFEPATFQSRVRRPNHWAIPAPKRLCFQLFFMCRLYISLELFYYTVIIFRGFQGSLPASPPPQLLLPTSGGSLVATALWHVRRKNQCCPAVPCSAPY